MASRNQRKNKRNNNRKNAAATREHQADDLRTLQLAGIAPGDHAPRASSETKSALRTTELIAYVATVLAVVMTALALDDDGQGGGDPFGAETALRYITYLTVGYLVARGLAKSGSWRTERRGDSARYDDTEGAGDPDGRDATREVVVIREQTVDSSADAESSRGDRSTSHASSRDDDGVPVTDAEDRRSSHGSAGSDGSHDPGSRDHQGEVDHQPAGHTRS